MSAVEHIETERKYAVASTDRVPDVHLLPGVDRVSVDEPLVLEAIYHDTPDLALARAGITLRRRTGGADAGWHLKLPRATDSRTEVQLPLGEAHDVPDELLERVRGLVRDRPVAPVAVLRTRRVVHHLLDSLGATLADLCDDEVTAEQGTKVTTWREWEVEVVVGPGTLLDATEAVLVTAGAETAPTSSKLARALGDRLLVPATDSDEAAEGSVGALLSGYLVSHVRRLLLEDLALRSGDHEGVHQMRIAARRLRSALATYRSMFTPDSTDRLRDELSWLGGVLAEARDAQVLRARLTDLVATQPPDLVLGPVEARIVDELSDRFRAGRQDADVALAGERYFRLLDELEAFVGSPPRSDRAAEPVRRWVPRLLHHDLDRVHARHRKVLESAEGDDRDAALHDLRKSLKRLRYAAETAEPVYRERAVELTKRAKALQDLLGEHQDTVVSRAALRGIAVRADAAGENAFTFGRLHGLEEGRAADLERAYPKAMRHLPHRRKVHAWLEH